MMSVRSANLSVSPCASFLIATRLRRVRIPRVVLALSAVLGVAIVLAVVIPVLMMRVLHGPVTERRLGISVGHVTGGGTIGPCTPTRVDDHLVEGRWNCGVWIETGSNGVDYTVRIRPGSSCWTASLARGSYGYRHRDGLPPRVDGCVRRWEWDPLGLSAS
jgi:hypothetical protein